jgi:cytochrome c2
MISWRKHYKQTLIAIGLLLSTSASIYGQDGDPKNGEKLFKANCTACHALDKQVVGPPLKGVVERVKTEAAKIQIGFTSGSRTTRKSELLATNTPMRFFKI